MYREAVVRVQTRLGRNFATNAQRDSLGMQQVDGLELAAVGTTPDEEAQIGRDEHVTQVRLLTLVTLNVNDTTQGRYGHKQV